MKLTELKFCSLLTYNPKGNNTKEAEQSRQYRYALKNDNSPKQNEPILMSEYIAKKVQQISSSSPFNMFFKPNVFLVPVPGSAVTRDDSFWVPKRLANALVNQGLGTQVFPCIKRIKAVPSAHMCKPEDRPDVQQHYDTLEVQSQLFAPSEILLIDDFVTSGAIFMACTNRLKEAFPESNIQAFAAIRTITRPAEFKKIYDPRAGIISLSRVKLCLDDFNRSGHLSFIKYKTIRHP